MAVVNRTSTALTNRAATPSVANNPQRASSELLEVVGLVTSAADDTSASIGRFFSIPSNARVSELRITSAAATTAGAIDIGLYKTPGDGSAVVDADFFASALALTAAQADADQKGESTVSYTTANSEKTIWEILGLAVDPCLNYDVAYTITTTFNGGPTAILLKARYVA